MSVGVWVSIRAIVAYQRHLSSHTDATCRHTPTCSEYAVLALQKHGFLRGWALALERVADCRPGSARPRLDLP